ncbi:hypothetical protein C9374_010748 [Naegleria lovaniensis]|uniref:Uncharacterized protein n=1 Tax=Naegleria lovaniensis TaxID=51637 RepID=A0AA88KFE2_NAELO|nr:uncharacterized protein C9374_010748 [Naegleria lovaniensis]KAG2374464.1 hypothetical protein C9374_010748 [Naegleria lovaniensis]
MNYPPPSSDNNNFETNNVSGTTATTTGNPYDSAGMSYLPYYGQGMNTTDMSSYYNNNGMPYPPQQPYPPVGATIYPPPSDATIYNSGMMTYPPTNTNPTSTNSYELVQQQPSTTNTHTASSNNTNTTQTHGVQPTTMVDRKRDEPKSEPSSSVAREEQVHVNVDAPPRTTTTASEHHAKHESPRSHRPLTRQNSIHLTCPRIHCDCFSSCPSFSDMNRMEKYQLFTVVGGVFFFILGLALFAVTGALYGVVNSDPLMVKDPNALIYVHRNCCTVDFVDECYTSKSKYSYNTYCKYQVTFPRLGTAALLNDTLRGGGITCSSSSTDTITRVTQNSYATSYYSVMTGRRNVDCYTDKEEKNVALREPYSELYSGMVTGAIVCVCFASVIIATIAIKVGVYLYVKWRD